MRVIVSFIFTDTKTCDQTCLEVTDLAIATPILFHRECTKKSILVKINHCILYLLSTLCITGIMVLLSCLVKLIEYMPAFVLHWGFSKIEPVEYSFEHFLPLALLLSPTRGFYSAFIFCLFFLHIPCMFCLPQDFASGLLLFLCATLSW